MYVYSYTPGAWWSGYLDHSGGFPRPNQRSSASQYKHTADTSLMLQPIPSVCVYVWRTRSHVHMECGLRTVRVVTVADNTYKYDVILCGFRMYIYCTIKTKCGNSVEHLVWLPWESLTQLFQFSMSGSRSSCSLHLARACVGEWGVSLWYNFVCPYDCFGVTPKMPVCM